MDKPAPHSPVSYLATFLSSQVKGQWDRGAGRVLVEPQSPSCGPWLAGTRAFLSPIQPGHQVLFCPSHIVAPGLRLVEAQESSTFSLSPNFAFSLSVLQRA